MNNEVREFQKSFPEKFMSKITYYKIQKMGV
jgi:hypothetical protein